MKPLEEIKNQVAVKHGYSDWEHILFNERWKFTDEVAEEYARQCCESKLRRVVSSLKNME